jgi:osmotically-inducible protein OsmY
VGGGALFENRGTIMSTSQAGTLTIEGNYRDSLPMPGFNFDDDNRITREIVGRLGVALKPVGKGETVVLKVDTVKGAVKVTGTVSTAALLRRVSDAVSEVRSYAEQAMKGTFKTMDGSGIVNTEKTVEVKPDQAPVIRDDRTITADVDRLVDQPLNESTRPGETITLNTTTIGGNVTITGETNSVMLYRRLGELVARARQEIREIKSIDISAVRHP